LPIPLVEIRAVCQRLNLLPQPNPASKISLL
jgi:hypothetical protein